MRRRSRNNTLYRRAMLPYRTKLGISVTIAANPRIVRRGPPAIGALFFDRDDCLIYVVSNPRPRYFTWHRVFTDGRLSQIRYEGFWDWGQGKRGSA